MLRAVGRRNDLWGGLVVGLVVSGAYSIGAGRAYGLDASVTVHRFVATSSILDPFDRQVVYNNHVLFSFIDHLVYSLTASSQEYVLRAVPIAASGLAVGVLAAAVARRLGWIPALAAATFIASSPMLILTGREVRGYSLLMLASVLSSVMFVALLRTKQSSQRRIVVGYVLALALGIGTHIYGLAMVVLHAAAVGGDRAELRRWLPRWMAGSAIGLACLVGVASTMIHAHRGRLFRLSFPVDLTETLLGGTWPIVLLMAVPVAVGVLALRSLMLLRVTLAVLALVLAAWIVAPTDLYPRFFVWLLPGVGLLVGEGVARYRSSGLLVGVVVLAHIARLGPTLTRDDLGNRQAARIAEQVATGGRSPCALGGLTAAAMEAYYSPIKVVGLTFRPPTCVVVFQLTPGPSVKDVEVPDSWRAAFPYRTVLDPPSRGVAFSGVSLSAASRTYGSAP